jgi:hypothetical protein
MDAPSSWMQKWSLETEESVFGPLCSLFSCALKVSKSILVKIRFRINDSDA